MPKAVIVSENEQEYLRTALSKKFNLSLQDTNDCKLLSDLVEQETGKPISYNTIRRLFRIVASSSPNSCSLFTLNVLAKALDFSDWISFQIYMKDYQISYQNHLIQMFRKQNAINHEKALELIKKMSFTDWKEGYWLKILNRLALEFEDYKFLKKLLLLDLQVKDPNVTDKLYFAFQDIHSNLAINVNLHKLIRDLMPDSENIQQIIMMCYVDENGMESFYGELLEKFKIVFKDDPQQMLFYQLMQLQKLYNKKVELKLLKKQYEKAFSIFKNCDQVKLVTIVKGRLAAWRWILFKNDDLYLSLLDLKDKKPKIGHYVDFFNRLTILFEKPYYDLVKNEQLLNHFRKDMDVLSFFDEGNNNQVKLGFAINHYLQNNHIEAKEWFLLTNNYVFDVIMFDWYANWHQVLENHFNSTPKN